jgi:hypothetical protein
MPLYHKEKLSSVYKLWKNETLMNIKTRGIRRNFHQTGEPPSTKKIAPIKQGRSQLCGKSE